MSNIFASSRFYSPSVAKLHLGGSWVSEKESYDIMKYSFTRVFKGLLLLNYSRTSVTPSIPCFLGISLIALQFLSSQLLVKVSYCVLEWCGGVGGGGRRDRIVGFKVKISSLHHSSLPPTSYQ